MITVLLGLGGALVYGAADFLGGLASRRVSAILVTSIGGVSGVVLIAALLPIVGGTWSSAAVALGALSGIAGAGAVALLYGCLAIGPMSILSPLTAVVSAIVPLIAGVIRGERLGPIGYIALAIALVAVVLVGFVPDRRAVRPSPRALVMAVGSGTLIGVFLIIIDLTPPDSGLVPLLFNKTVNAALLGAVLAVIAITARAPRRRVGGPGARMPRPPVVGGPTLAVPAFGDHGAPASEAAIPGPVAEAAAVPEAAVEPAVAEPVPAANAADAASALRGDRRPGLTLAIACGLVDTTANVLLLLALRTGDLSVVSVLTAMYPAGTIVLAAIVLRERIALTQYVGLALAIVAAALLSLG